MNLFQHIASILHSRGWLTEGTECPVKLKEAVKAFQKWLGFDPDGEIDYETMRALQSPRFCALPDVLPLSATQCKWPDGLIPYYVLAAFPGLTLAQTWDHFDWAMNQWAGAANLTPRRASNAATARIVATIGNLDGPSGVLAQSELPCGSITQARQTYDSAEAWDRQIQAKLVILHELGHALGIPHIGTGNVMAPIYNPALTTLQSGDIAEIVGRYGRSPQTPTPTPTPPGNPVPGNQLLIDVERRSIIAPQGWSITVRPQ